MESFDVNLTTLINAPAGSYPLIDAVISALTIYGVPLLIIAVALQWLLKKLVLLFVHRVRPYDAGISHLIIEKSADWSFPSDHTTAVVAIAAAFALLGFRTQAWLFALAAILVCYSRVYVGMHYASDVAGGAVTGLGAAFLICKIYSPDWPINRALVKIL
jgi:undecaprenyl-diphosphatase